ncbi:MULTISPECIES: ATP-binding protein [Streptomycetaceae]|uniref:ATP-binding protein n=1 Tax=Kitasatospora herbaricolor TaxID=68217 RepID=A0ABZ1WAY2_9ACTN|nr:MULTISPECIES: ATP-binding protein [Streptomycetaceae]OKI24492.1 anti-sigma regulatory factor [Streptomyces sp. CB03911]GGV03686.1 anti-sigma regulatory factor [Kitasatospora herbaricolor]
MATVELRFSALPEHVRTARLVAAAVARRAGVDESVLDEVRLAVGEACSRAVGLHQRGGVTAGAVRVALTDQEKRFLIEVEDEAGPASVPDPGVDEDADEDTLGLAVITGLVEDLEVTHGARGGVIRMSWPVSVDALAH